MHLEASIKPHVCQKFEIFWTNNASTMACPNFKNGLKNGLKNELCPLGIKEKKELGPSNVLKLSGGIDMSCCI